MILQMVVLSVPGKVSKITELVILIHLRTTKLHLDVSYYEHGTFTVHHNIPTNLGEWFVVFV